MGSFLSFCFVLYFSLTRFSWYSCKLYKMLILLTLSDKETEAYSVNNLPGERHSRVGGGKPSECGGHTHQLASV